ncbi:hypothetical protein [Streptomyces sp. UG1]|uniref:hypothetical protein n=1 Tax=Streptomyces sp. UG1 TaxID=3417652 RepID=UPI003CF4B762
MTIRRAPRLEEPGVDFAELTDLLDEGRTRITRHAHKRAISDAIRALDAVRTTGTIGEVLDLMADGHLLALPGKLKDLERRRSATHLDERDQRRADFSNNLRTVSYREVISIAHFIDELTPFSTQHGVKGDEFENVVVVVDDRAWNRYSIGKMLAGTDKPDRTERSRNLFYVCCSPGRSKVHAPRLVRVGHHPPVNYVPVLPVAHPARWHV